MCKNKTDTLSGRCRDTSRFRDGAVYVPFAIQRGCSKTSFSGTFGKQSLGIAVVVRQLGETESATLENGRKSFFKLREANVDEIDRLKATL